MGGASGTGVTDGGVSAFAPRRPAQSFHWRLKQTASDRNEETRALKGTAAPPSGCPATKNTAVPSPSTGGRRRSF